MDVQHINILLKRSNINYWTYDQTLTFEAFEAFEAGPISWLEFLWLMCE